MDKREISMCYNFDFLKKEEKYKEFTNSCIEAG
jgi:type I restriction enzyme R subunit